MKYHYNSSVDSIYIVIPISAKFLAPFFEEVLIPLDILFDTNPGQNVDVKLSIKSIALGIVILSTPGSLA